MSLSSSLWICRRLAEPRSSPVPRTGALHRELAGSAWGATPEGARAPHGGARGAGERGEGVVRLGETWPGFPSEGCPCPHSWASSFPSRQHYQAPRCRSPRPTRACWEEVGEPREAPRASPAFKATALGPPSRAHEMKSQEMLWSLSPAVTQEEAGELLTLCAKGDLRRGFRMLVESPDLCSSDLVSSQ